MGLATRKRSPLTWSAESTEWTRRQVLARKMNEDPLFQRERRYRPVKEESDFMASPQRLSLVATLCAFVALNWCDGLCLVTPCVATKNNAVSFIMHNIYCTTEKPHLYPKRVQSVVAYEDSVSFLRYHYSTKFSLHLLNCWSRTFKQKKSRVVQHRYRTIYQSARFDGNSLFLLWNSQRLSWRMSFISWSV